MTDEETRAAFAHADALLALKAGDLVRLKDEAYLSRKEALVDQRVPSGTLLRVAVTSDTQPIIVHAALDNGGIETLYILPHQFGPVEIVERAGE